MIVIATLDIIFLDNLVDHLIDDRRSVWCTNWQLAEAVIDTEVLICQFISEIIDIFIRDLLMCTVIKVHIHFPFL